MRQVVGHPVQVHTTLSRGELRPRVFFFFYMQVFLFLLLFFFPTVFLFDENRKMCFFFSCGLFHLIIIVQLSAFFLNTTLTLFILVSFNDFFELLKKHVLFFFSSLVVFSVPMATSCASFSCLLVRFGCFFTMFVTLTLLISSLSIGDLFPSLFFVCLFVC